MAQISYIHGFPFEESEVKERSALVPPPRFIDFSTMTSGELNLFLIREQLDILRNFYMDTKKGKAFDMGFNLLTDTIHRGVHKINDIGGNIPSEIYPILKSIRQAKSRTEPASGLKTNVTIGSVIPILDCPEFVHKNDWSGTSAEYAVYQKNRKNCLDENDWRRLLNEHMEPMAHHPIYEFVSNPNAVPQVVTSKSVLHRLAISNIHTFTKISRDNIRLWQRNGIMRHNAKKGAGVLSPEKSIEAIKQAQDDNISGLQIAVVIAVLKAVAAALTAAGLFIAALKNKQPSAEQLFKTSLQGWGTPDYGAEKTDWEKHKESQFDKSDGKFLENILSDENMPLLLAVGSGLLLLTDNKE
jgi:hypothetical protein